MIWYDKAAMLRVNTVEFFSKNLHENRVFTSQRREVFLFLTTNIAAVTYKPVIAPLKIQLTFFSAKHLPRLLFASKVENYAGTDGIVNAFFFKLEGQSCQNEC